MMGYEATTALGHVAAGEVDTVFMPRTPRVGTCGLVLLHGAGIADEWINSATAPNAVVLAATLASAGIPTISGELGGQTWGNATARSRIDAAWGVLKGLYPQMRTDKVALLGVSMGGACVSIYAQQFPAKVAAMVGIIPLLDLVSFYNANSLGTQSQIATAWGATAPNPLPAEANNAANAALAKSVPLLCGYSAVDTVVLPSWVTSYCAQVPGSTCMSIDSNYYGHADATVGEMPIATVGQFLAANGC